ncbi:MAG TPA: lipid II flippase MurJ, partial [Bryobacteraceae bacterium]|nr:lipid II flippase MurJ [Bryobacteraceae bacterium]
RFMQLPLGLFGVAIGSATLPSISRSAAAGRMDEFRHTLSKSLGMVFLLTVPSSVGLIVLGKSIIGAIYQGGKFEPYDTQQTALALSCYAIGLAGYAALKVLTPAFYALNDARIPMIVSLISVAINYVTAVVLIRVYGFGHAGLAMSTSVVALFGFVTLFAILRVRIGGIYGRDLAAGIVKVLGASAVMAAAIAVSSHLIEARLGTSRLGRLADVAVSVPIGFAVYYAVCKMLHVDDLDMAIRAVAAPVRRRLGRRPIVPS